MGGFGLEINVSRHHLSRIIEHLSSQFERGLPMLFLGAGFSLGATSISTLRLPSVEDLKKDLWRLCFPGEEYASSASLQNLYESALRLHGRNTADLLRTQLTVDSDTLRDWYESYFSMPRARVYTLNIDDLPRAAGRKFTLPRQLHLISALREQYEPPPDYRQLALEVVHLNGDVDGIPNNITFSTTQYAERIARPDSWYVRVVADLVSRPFVFIGTQLEEPPLWQHIELRKHRGDYGTRELRPRSYLVVPSLDAARRSLLSDYNIVWVRMTAQDFEAQVLTQLRPVREAGLTAWRTNRARIRSNCGRFPSSLDSRAIQRSRVSF
jgi:SIR2-like domain